MTSINDKRILEQNTYNEKALERSFNRGWEAGSKAREKEIVGRLEMLLPDKANRAFMSLETVKENDIGLAYRDGVNRAIVVIQE